MKVLDEYPTHHYLMEFEKCNLYCPLCGDKSVWQEQGGGDYYFGEEFICTSCKHNFTIQGPCLMSELNQLKKIEQLLSGKTAEPSTPRGH